MVKQCPHTLTSLRDRAILTLGFAGAFRRSELAALTVADLEETPAGLRVTIRHSKTDQAGVGQTIAVYNQRRETAGGTALKAWLAAANIGEHAKPGETVRADVIINFRGDGKQVFSAWSSIKPTDRRQTADLPLI